jgi:hypothetical protein
VGTSRVVSAGITSDDDANAAEYTPRREREHGV